MALYQVDGVMDRRAGSDHVIDNQHRAMQGRSGNNTAFAVVLFLLPVETVR